MVGWKKPRYIDFEICEHFVTLFSLSDELPLLKQKNTHTFFKSQRWMHADQQALSNQLKSIGTIKFFSSDKLVDKK